MSATTVTTSGSFTPAADAWYLVQITAPGGNGGNGGINGGDGGGGGAFSQGIVFCPSGVLVNYVIPSNGDAYFKTAADVMAKGGTTGANSGGQASASIGTLKHSGGSGSAHASTAGGQGGTPGTALTDGTTGGVAGGANNQNGTNGQSPGGGGGGGGASGSGGTGGIGQIIYQDATKTYQAEASQVFTPGMEMAAGQVTAL